MSGRFLCAAELVACLSLGAPVFLTAIALRIGGAQAEQVDLPPEALEFLPMLRSIVDELA